MRPLFGLLLALAACSRPLTEAETQFATDLFGDTLNVGKVRVAHGLGLTPPPKLVPGSVKKLRGTEQACIRTPQPGARQPAQAFALRNGVFFSSALYSSDMALTWPKGMRFPQALIFAHELTHVWQWQNRGKTGYSPWRAIRERLRLADPYFSANGEEPEFLRFGFEQQAAIVEDFVCFTIANPRHPRRQELRAVLAPILPVEAFEAAIQR